jgi:heme/copper-type cytochrome/quinol oxidase subunit 3
LYIPVTFFRTTPGTDAPSLGELAVDDFDFSDSPSAQLRSRNLTIIWLIAGATVLFGVAILALIVWRQAEKRPAKAPMAAQAVAAEPLIFPGDHSGPNTQVLAALAWWTTTCVYLVLTFYLIIWTARDSRARGMDSAWGWIVMILFLGCIGWVIYMAARPNGRLHYCHNCRNRKLAAALACCHCGAARD